MEELNVTETRGFSFLSEIENKANNEELKRLGRGWIWAPGGTSDHLLDCLTKKGWAVTPGHWEDGWKNNKRSKMFCASYVFLDYDGGRNLKSAVADHFNQTNASFIYTTYSHGIKPGDRYRIVYELDEPVVAGRDYDPVQRFNQILEGLKLLQPGSDPAINSVSCLFGNNRSPQVINFGSNQLDTSKCLAAYEEAQAKREMKRNLRVDNPSRVFDGDISDTEHNLRTWLQAVDADGYHLWRQVGSWLKGVVYTGEISEEQGLNIYLDWSIANYVGEKHQRNQPDVIERTWDSLDGYFVDKATGEIKHCYGLIRIRQLYLSRLLTEFNDLYADKGDVL